jgi:hypothetical protein
MQETNSLLVPGSPCTPHLKNLDPPQSSSLCLNLLTYQTRTCAPKIFQAFLNPREKGEQKRKPAVIEYSLGLHKHVVITSKLQKNPVPIPQMRSHTQWPRSLWIQQPWSHHSCCLRDIESLPDGTLTELGKGQTGAGQAWPTQPRKGLSHWPEYRL